MSNWYMGKDQYGNTYDGLRHPRKDLMERLDCKHAQKMYVDDRNDNSFHVGYIIQGHWIRIYKVIPMRQPA